MAWPDGINQDIILTIEMMYEKYDLLEKPEWYAAKEEFKNLVSEWFIKNPHQKKFLTTEKDRKNWEDFLHNHFWKDALSNVERNTRELTYKMSQPDYFEEGQVITTYKKKKKFEWINLVYAGIAIIFATPFVIGIGTVVLYLILSLIQSGLSAF